MISRKNKIRILTVFLVAFHVILKGLRIWDRNSFRLRPSRAFNSNFGIPAKLLKKEVLLTKDFSYKVNLNIIWHPVRKNYVLALDKQAILFIFAASYGLI